MMMKIKSKSKSNWWMGYKAVRKDDIRLLNVLRERVHNAVLGNLCQRSADRLHKPLVATQVVTEQAADAEQAVRVADLGQRAQVVEHGVGNLELVAVVVHAVDVVEPERSGETEAVEGASNPDSLGDGGHDELRDLAGTTTADTRQLVLDGGVGEALDERLAVVVDVEVCVGDLGQSVLHLALHHLPDELGEQRVLHHLVHVLVACELAAVRDHRMAAVQQTELVLLELLDVLHVLHDLHADLLEGWPAVAEVVFDHPLHERLGDDRPRVFDAKLLCERDLVGRGSLGGDTVNHSVGEVTVGVDPVRELVVLAQTGERKQHVAGDRTVALHVVARHDGKRLQTLLEAALHRVVEETECSLRSVTRVQVVLDIRVLALQLVGVFIIEVAALGDGQGHDVGIGVGHLGNDGFAVVGGKEVGIDAAHHLGNAALGGALDHSVEVVLRAEGVAHADVKGLQADTADGVVGHAMMLHEVVDVDGQVSAVEATDADVDNSLLDGIAPREGGDLNGRGGRGRGRDLGQVLAVELDGAHGEGLYKEERRKKDEMEKRTKSDTNTANSTIHRHRRKTLGSIKVLSIVGGPRANGRSQWAIPLVTRYGVDDVDSFFCRNPEALQIRGIAIGGSRSRELRWLDS